jgi:hypothetical protein
MNCGRSEDRYVKGQDNDMLPAREYTPELFYKDGPHNEDQEPSRVFIMEEHIEGYSTILSTATPKTTISVTTPRTSTSYYTLFNTGSMHTPKFR